MDICIPGNTIFTKERERTTERLISMAQNIIVMKQKKGSTWSVGFFGVVAFGHLIPVIVSKYHHATYSYVLRSFSTRFKYSFSTNVSICFFTRITGGLKRLFSWSKTSASRFWWFDFLRIFMMRTIAAFFIQKVNFCLRVNNTYLNSQTAILFNLFDGGIRLLLDFGFDWHRNVLFAFFTRFLFE